MADVASTTDPAVNPRAGDQGDRYLHRRRISSNVFLAVMTAVFVLGLVNVAGVRSSTTSATSSTSAGDYRLDVRHGTVARAGLATPLDITVIRSHGFDAPVMVGITREYLALFAQNGMVPEPSSATTMGDWLLWEFAPPVGDTLSITLDVRIEPARSSAIAAASPCSTNDINQSSRSGSAPGSFPEGAFPWSSSYAPPSCSSSSGS